MKHFCHYSAGSTVEIFLTLSRVLKQRVVEALWKSKAFGLLVDKVTHVSVMEKLIGFAQYVSDDGEAMVKFLSSTMFWRTPETPMLKQSLCAFLHM